MFRQLDFSSYHWDKHACVVVACLAHTWGNAVICPLVRSQTIFTGLHDTLVIFANMQATYTLR